MSALAFVDGDAHRLAGGPIGLALGESSEANLRSLKVGKNANGFAGGIRCFADSFVVRLVIRVVTMAEVQSGDIHATLDEFADALTGGGRRSKGANDLSTSAHGHERSRYPAASLWQRGPTTHYRSVASSSHCSTILDRFRLRRFRRIVRPPRAAVPSGAPETADPTVR